MPGRNHAAVERVEIHVGKQGESEPPWGTPRSVSYSRPRARTRRCKSRSMRSMVHLSMMRGPNNARSRARSKESKQSTKSVRTTHRWPSSRSATSVRIASPTPTPGRYPNDHGDKSGSMAGVRIWVSARSTTRSSATGTERRRTPAVPFGTGTSFSGCGRHSPARRPSLIAGKARHRVTGERSHRRGDRAIGGVGVQHALPRSGEVLLRTDPQPEIRAEGCASVPRSAQGRHSAAGISPRRLRAKTGLARRRLERPLHAVVLGHADLEVAFAPCPCRSTR